MREHGDDDPDEVRKARLLASLDNGCAIGLSRSQKSCLLETSRSHDAVIRVCVETSNLIETHEHTDDFKAP